MRRFWLIFAAALLLAILAGSVVLCVNVTEQKNEWESTHTETGVVVYALHNENDNDIVVEFADGTRVAYTGNQYRTVIVGDEVSVVKEQYANWKIIAEVYGFIVFVGCGIPLALNWGYYWKEEDYDDVSNEELLARKG